MPTTCRLCDNPATHTVTFRCGPGFVGWVHLCSLHMGTWSGEGVPKTWVIDSIDPIESTPGGLP